MDCDAAWSNHSPSVNPTNPSSDSHSPGRKVIGRNLAEDSGIERRAVLRVVLQRRDGRRMPWRITFSLLMVGILIGGGSLVIAAPPQQKPGKPTPLPKAKPS